MSLFLPVLLAVISPTLTLASVNANLVWTASTDSSVVGYNIYYGGSSHQYTNFITVGNVTSAVIPGLAENTTYFFAAKAVNSSGNESDFSNETAFDGVNSSVGAAIHVATMPQSFTGGSFTFSLDSSAPTGATINPTNGVLSWAPDYTYASTTNYINVYATDSANLASNITETLVVIVSGSFQVNIGSTAVSAGQTGSLPLSVTSSSTVTNIQITLAWPSRQLLSPSLTFSGSVVSGTLQNQNNQLVIQLQTAADQPFSGSNVVAQINFLATPSQTSSILGIPAAAVSGNTAVGGYYASAVAKPGEVVVVGNQPLLRPQATSASGRALSLYANPGTYELEYATSLVPPVNWVPLTTYQQTNVTQSVSLDSSSPVVFYRLHQL